MPNNQTTTNLVQKVCTKCGESYPKDYFKRRLTKRQSASLLRRSAVKSALTVISSRCRFCWQQTKRKTPLTDQDIRNKKASGDLNEVMADIMLKTRKENANLIKSRVMKEYWEKKRAEPIKALEKNLRQQVAKYRNRYHATKSKDPHHALLRQHSENYKRAREVRDDLLSRAKAGEVIDPNVLIAKFFTKGVDDV
jgi:hypothetical protein